MKLKGPELATLKKPPNITQFDPVSTHTVVSKSPILQQHLNNMAKEHGPQAPVVNIVLPNNFSLYQEFGMQDGRAPGPVTALPTQMPGPISLIPTNYTEG